MDAQELKALKRIGMLRTFKTLIMNQMLRHMELRRKYQLELKQPKEQS